MSFVTPSGGGGGAIVEQSVRVTFAMSPYPVSATDQKMVCDCTGGNIIVNLPTAIGINGRVLTIKKMDITTNTVTITPFGAQTIDIQPNYVISIPNDSISVEADSGNWWIV
jgi:hypothetical protein